MMADCGSATASRLFVNSTSRSDESASNKKATAQARYVSAAQRIPAFHVLLLAEEISASKPPP